MLPKFRFRVSRNFAKFEGNFAKHEIENFAKLRKWNFSQPPYTCPAPNIPFELWRIFCRFCHDHTVQCTSYFQHIPRWLFFLVSDAFTWAGDAGGVQIWSFLTLPVWGQFSLGRSYKKYPASGGAKICGAWEYLIAPASQSKLGYSSPRSSDLLNTLGLFKT